MKKSTSIVLILILLVGIIGCGNNDFSKLDNRDKEVYKNLSELYDYCENMIKNNKSYDEMIKDKRFYDLFLKCNEYAELSLDKDLEEIRLNICLAASIGAGTEKDRDFAREHLNKVKEKLNLLK